MKFLLNSNFNINSVDEFRRTPYLLSEENSENQNYLNKYHANTFITPYIPEGSFNYKHSFLYNLLSLVIKIRRKKG